MPTIPEVREKLTEIADKMRQSTDLDIVFMATEIDQAVKDLFRRSAPRKAPAKLSPLTEEEKARIRTMAWANPGMSQLDIANEIGTNPGRVSEALNGKRR